MKIYWAAFFICAVNVTLGSQSVRGNDKDYTPSHWIHQVDSVMMPFWMMDEALGNPVGNFPNYRCNDGTLGDCDELRLENLHPIILTQSDSLKRDFLRMKSRQIYAYCVAFHLTGTEQYLEYAKAGIDYLLKVGEYESGSPVTYWQDGQPQPKKWQRTSQDLAYSLTGLSMYYYLTRDPRVRKAITTVKNHIFTEYFEKSTVSAKTKLMMWVKEDSRTDNANTKSLIAQLDQLNAYLLQVAPLLPDDQKQKYINDARTLCYIMKDNFYDEALNLFWSDLDNKKIGLHTDFGHSIKVFWMCHITGKLSNDETLVRFAEKNARRLLQVAYLEKTGSWAMGYIDENKGLLKDKQSWIYAELDQMAATLSFQDTSIYSKYLKKTYNFWDENFLDYDQKGVYFAVDEYGQPNKMIPKAFHWRNGYHTLEHALVGYISSCNYYGQDITLYYAFEKQFLPEKNQIRPYYFRAEIKSMEELSFVNPVFVDFQKTKVVFRNVN